MLSAGSSRIQHCDCNFQFRPSTLIDPCHMAFVYGCLSDMPEDASCCPDPELAYYEAGAYVNGGTCIAQSLSAGWKSPLLCLPPSFPPSTSTLSLCLYVPPWRPPPSRPTAQGSPLLTADPLWSHAVEPQPLILPTCMT